MSAQVEVQGESLLADVALVGLLSRVHQLVPLQFGVVQESLVAALDGADVGSLCVGDLVLSVGALIPEGLGAVVYRTRVSPHSWATALCDLRLGVVDLLQRQLHQLRRLLLNLLQQVAMVDSSVSQDVLDIERLWTAREILAFSAADGLQKVLDDGVLLHQVVVLCSVLRVLRLFLLLLPTAFSRLVQLFVAILVL